MIALLLSLVLLQEADAPSEDPTAPIIIDAPNLEVVIRREFYGVTGRNIRAARNAIMTRQVSVGNAASARAEWSYDYYYTTDADSCDLDSYYVYLMVTLTYPVWREFESRSRRQREQWDEMFLEFQNHENIHAEIAIRGAERLRDGMAALAAENWSTCGEIGEAIDALSEESADWMERNQLEYDRLSVHGIEQENIADWQPHDSAVGR